MSATDPDARTNDTSQKKPRTGGRFSAGPLVFALTLVAVLAFFWWLLIYDHGVGAGG